jgi:uncharacterized protein DUF6869
MVLGHSDSESEFGDLAAGYLRCARSLRENHDPDGIWSPETNPDEAAYEAVDRAIREGPLDTAWALVKEILRQAPDEQLAAASVGTLEPLLQRRGGELVDRVEQEAQMDERFRWALACIWLCEGDMPADALARIVRASGGEIKPLGPRRRRH